MGSRSEIDIGQPPREHFGDDAYFLECHHPKMALLDFTRTLLVA
jgi:hypothetical protein